MTEKQKRLYQLFKEIDKICKDNDIDYFMAGGTLIGVVRHKGFIPWDDDMDILMTRDNFHKFIKACETDIPKNRVLECQELNHNYHNAVARYTSCENSAIHSTQIVHDDAAGFVVDILILDPIEDTDKKYKAYCKDLLLYCDLINNSIVYSYRWRVNMLRYSLYRLKCRLKGREKVLCELESRLFSAKEDECDYLVMRWGGCPFIFKKDMYGKGKYLKFEEIDSQVPEKTWEYLVWHYGDEWMEIPPHSEQEGHNAIYSFHTDYKTLRNDYLKLVNVKKYNRICTRNKLIATYVMTFWSLFKDFVYKRKAKQYQSSFGEFFSKNKQKIKTLCDMGDFFALDEFFKDYLSVQMSADFIGREDYSGAGRFHHPILIDVGDELLCVAVEVLFNTGRIAKAMRLIDVIKEKKGALPKQLKKIRRDIFKYRDIARDLAEKEISPTDTRIEELLQDHPFSISFIKLKLNLLREFGATPEEFAPFISSGLMLKNDDGEIIKHSIDTQNDAVTPQVIKQYVDAYYLTNNGLVLLDIDKILRDNFDAVISVAKDDKTYAQKLYEILQTEELLEILFAHLSGVCDFELARKWTSKFSDKQKAQSVFYNYLLKITSSGKQADLLCKNEFDLISESTFADADFDADPTLCFVAGEYFYKKGDSKLAFEFYEKATNTNEPLVLQLLNKVYLSEINKLVYLSKTFESFYAEQEFRAIHSDKLKLTNALKRLSIIDNSVEVVDFDVLEKIDLGD